jgi:copper transport protein
MIVLRPPTGGGRPLPPLASVDLAAVRYVLVLLWGLLICAVDGTAFAHTLLDASEPVDGASLAEPVKAVTLRFTAHVTPLVMRMLQPTGDIVRLTDVTASGAVVIVRLPVSDQHGTNIISWRVVSDDGHPVGGTVSFSVAAGARPLAGTDLLEFRSYRLALWSSGFVQSICITLAIGGAMFRAFVAPATRTWLASLIIAAAVAGLLAEIAGTVVQTVDGLGEDFTAVGWDDLWWTLSRTAYGRAAWLTAAGMLCSLGVSISRLRWMQQSLSVVGLACACLGFVVVGHASQATPKLLVYPGMFLHVTGMLIWFGALLPLGAALRADGATAGQGALVRLSRPLLFIAFIMPATGLLLAFIQLQNVSELWGSAYGIVLLLKIAVLVPLFSLAAANRFVLTARVARGEQTARRWMARSVFGEALLAALVLGVIGLWRFTPPPREMSSVQVTASGVQLHAHGIAAMVNLTFNPARVGVGNIRLSVLNLDSTALNARAVDVALFRPGGPTEPVHLSAHRGAGTAWQVDSVDFVSPGRWLVRVDIVLPDQEKVYARSSVDIADR